jgi:hypothetical protein
MSNGVLVATVVLMGVSVPARAQVAPVTRSSAILQERPDFPRFAAPTSRPASVKWGMVIGGVAGATVGAVLVFGHPCHGDDCWVRPAVAILPIGIGAAVGIMVGGAVGNAIARDREFNVSGGAVSRRPGARIGVGIRLSLPTPH